MQEQSSPFGFMVLNYLVGLFLPIDHAHWLKARSDRRKTLQGWTRCNAHVKRGQLDNSLSYCILRSPSERALALETVSDHLPPPIPVLGLAACSCVVHLLNSGEHMIAMDDLYGGSNRLFRKVVEPKMNIETTFIDMTDPTKV